MSVRMYRIGEAAALLGLKSYVLRFWETEFPQLEPVRTERGQRLYTQEHIDLLQLIRHLLHERGLTIDGARRILNSPDLQKIMREEPLPAAPAFSSEVLSEQEALEDDSFDGDEPLNDPELVPRVLLEEVIEELEEIRSLLLPLDEEEGSMIGPVSHTAHATLLPSSGGAVLTGGVAGGGEVPDCALGEKVEETAGQDGEVVNTDAYVHPESMQGEEHAAALVGPALPEILPDVPPEQLSEGMLPEPSFAHVSSASATLAAEADMPHVGNVPDKMAEGKSAGQVKALLEQLDREIGSALSTPNHISSSEIADSNSDSQSSAADGNISSGLQDNDFSEPVILTDRADLPDLPDLEDEPVESISSLGSGFSEQPGPIFSAEPDLAGRASDAAPEALVSALAEYSSSSVSVASVSRGGAAPELSGLSVQPVPAMQAAQAGVNELDASAEGAGLSSDFDFIFKAFVDQDDE